MIFMKYNRVGRARQALQYLPKLIANNKPKKTKLRGWKDPAHPLGLPPFYYSVERPYRSSSGCTQTSRSLVNLAGLILTGVQPYRDAQ